MNDIKKRQAYELYNLGKEYPEIAQELKVKQADVIRAVAELSHSCDRCHWRRDGREICLLPSCMKYIEI